jgi:hypothetical protein
VAAHTAAASAGSVKLPRVNSEPVVSLIRARPPGMKLTREQSVSNLVSVLRCFARALTIFALCCAIGLHWIALQSVAWTTMLIDYSKNAPLCQAIAQTFDGAHPCSLCHAVNAGKHSEKKSDLQTATPKIDMICASRTTSLLRSFVSVEYAARDFSSDTVGRSPPAPPPRRLLG